MSDDAQAGGANPAVVNVKKKGKAAVRKKSVVREYAEAIVVAVALTLLIRTFVIQAFRIPTGSMEDTLLVGDFLFVNKFIYGAHVPFTDATLPALRKPRRGDIMVFRYPRDTSRDFIKRVIGLPGETLEIKDKVVYVDGKALDEPYVKHTNPRTQPRDYRDPLIYPPGLQMGNRDNYGPFVVPDGQYFMMGDNRDNSDDSRFWGTLDPDLIRGKAIFIYWSWDKGHTRPRMKRIGNLIR
jgi:signal peptidase I